MCLIGTCIALNILPFLRIVIFIDVYCTIRGTENGESGIREATSRRIIQTVDSRCRNQEVCVYTISRLLFTLSDDESFFLFRKLSTERSQPDLQVSRGMWYIRLLLMTLCHIIVQTWKMKSCRSSW